MDLISGYYVNDTSKLITNEIVELFLRLNHKQDLSQLDFQCRPCGPVMYSTYCSVHVGPLI